MSDFVAIDPHDISERRTERARRLAVIELPLVRLGGSILLSLGVLLHDRYVLHDSSLGPWLNVSAILAAYCAVTWLVLVAGFRLSPPRDFTVAAFAGDMIVWTYVIYRTGGEQSWLFFILLMRVGDQTQTTLRRCLAFAVFGTFCYAAMNAWIVLVDGRTIDLTVASVKTSFLMISGFYIAMAARTAEARRARLTQTIRLSRDLIRQLEEQSAALTEAREHAEEASAAKSEFVASMSHEMRTPLHGILGMLQLARDRAAAPDVQRHLDMAQRSAETLAATIDQILDFSKIEARKIDLSPAWFDVREMVNDVVTAIGIGASAKKLTLRVEIADDVPARAWADALRLRQVLMNLIGNSMKFTEAGEIVATVWRRDSLLEFAVRDSGIGIDSQMLTHIFEPFTQGDARRFRGTGLGLSIVRQLVEAMGGTIDVDSGVGRGSTFRFTIATRFGAPASAGVVETKAHAEAGVIETKPPAEAGVIETKPPAEAGAPLRRISVLAVDDNLINLEFAAEAVRRLGHDVEVASSGEEALSLVKSRRFDLILMDVQMPGIDGLEATRRLRASGSDMRIVALTAHSTAEDRKRCLDAGMDDVLVKPVNTARLAAVLHGPIPDEIANNRVLFARVREAFAAQTPMLLAEMREAIARGDSAMLARHAHTMKGALSNFLAEDAVNAAATLEKNAKANELSGARDDLARLDASLRAVFDALQIER